MLLLFHYFVVLLIACSKKLALLCFPPAKRKVKRFYLEQTPLSSHTLFSFTLVLVFFTSPYSRSLHLPDVIRALWVLHVNNKKTPHTSEPFLPLFCVVVAAFTFATSDDTRFVCFRAPLSSLRLLLLVVFAMMHAFVLEEESTPQNALFSLFFF